MERRFKADFHTHLGDQSDERLLGEAISNQVKVLGVMDRGIVRTNRLKTLIEKAAHLGITTLPAVECLTWIPYNGRLISQELIGLDFNLNNPLLFHNFDPNGEVCRDKHQRKVRFQTEYLQNQGFVVERNANNLAAWQIIDSGCALDTAIRLCRIAAADEYNQKLITQDGILKHLAQRPEDAKDPQAKYLFWEHFALGKPGYRNWQLDVKTIVDTIHQAGGVVLIPHPKFRHQTNGDLMKIIDNAFLLGIDGIEGWDADLLERDLARIARASKKLVLGGSGQDINYYSNRVIGEGDINTRRMFISPRRLDDLINYKAIHHLIG